MAICQSSMALSRVYNTNHRKQTKDKDAPPTAIDLFKECHCNSKMGFNDPVKNDGIVLLKNDAGALPLDRATVRSAAVIGPNANDPAALNGNYFGPPCETTTPLQGVQRYIFSVRFLAGCDSPACGFAATGQAAALASSSDQVIMFMGLSQDQEKEGLDRTSLLLPGKQQSLITAVASAARRPVILVLLTGGPVDVTFAKNNPKIGAILWAGYPGQAGGLAIAKVLFGDHNPSGRLPVTWYPEEFTRIPMTDMRMRADPATGYPGRSYRFYQGNPVYKFGYGLSYSKFSRRLVAAAKPRRPNRNLLAGVIPKPAGDGGESYHVEEIGEEGCERLKFPATVEVHNHGPMDGKHSVLVFVRWPNATAGASRPARQLVGFSSQHVRAGEKARLTMEINPCEHLSRAREDGTKIAKERDRPDKSQQAAQISKRVGQMKRLAGGRGGGVGRSLTSGEL
uniref:Fibronectin type III-like domain-containing protein n=1 Tax=Oryza glumipatula TaxID=40148 RepID=A0A0E0BHU9_9ORYZ